MLLSLSCRNERLNVVSDAGKLLFFFNDSYEEGDRQNYEDEPRDEHAMNTEFLRRYGTTASEAWVSSW